MSIKLMAQVWESPVPSGRKLVLLALCDNSNDQGECYPSIPTIAHKCSMGVRTVQQHITDLEIDGMVIRQMRAGRSTLYKIAPCKFGTPAESAPPQISHPAKSAPPQDRHHTPADSAPSPPQNSHHTPADFAPITIKEPSIESSGKRKAKKSAAKKPDFELPEWIPADAWAGYLEMRKEIRKPMTRNAYVLAVNRLRILHRDGQDPRAVLEQSTLNSWQGLFALRVETKGKGGGAWWLDDVSRMAKAAEVGVRSNPGESVASFEGRIRAAIDNGGTPPVPKPAPVVRISDHQDSGNVSRTPDAARARTLALAAALKKGQA